MLVHPLPAIAATLLLPALAWAEAALALVATRDSQLIQNRRADADNLSRMRDVAMVRRFHRAGYLVRVPSSSRHYYLKSVPANYRYLRPWSKLFLDRLSRQYHARFGKRLRVTSMVRTVQFQNALARRNGNAAAATGARASSHLTGATLDISKTPMTAAEVEWMRRVLASLKRQGVIYAVEEFQQPTFHIMVYKNYPEYVQRITSKKGR